MSEQRPISFKFYDHLFKHASIVCENALNSLPLDANLVQSILRNRVSSKGLDLEDIAKLLLLLRNNPDNRLRSIVIHAAKQLRDKLYGNTVAAMVPIEVSSYCSSNCRFCGWNRDNGEVTRLRLSLYGILSQIRYLAQMGYSHYEIASGDDIDLIKNKLPMIVSEVKKLLNKVAQGSRLSICLTPLPEEYMRVLARNGLDCVMTWQETYDSELYYNTINKGPKAYALDRDLKPNKERNGFVERMLSQEKAVRSGLQIGMGVMLGLSSMPETDILAVICHAKKLVSTYSSNIMPVIFGMPTCNPIASGGMLGENSINPESDFPLISALYLLSMPDRYAWIFSNCRVSRKTQLRCIKTASCFASTMVRVAPGGYIHMDDDDQEMFDRSSILTESKNIQAILADEQFQHFYADHWQYVDDFRKNGLVVVSERDYLDQMMKEEG